MSRIDTVLMDFDGTMMDTNDVIIRSWQETYRVLRGEEGSLEEILATFGEPLELSMENLFPEVPLEESLPIYRGYQRDNFLKSIRLFPGVIELLDELKARGYKLGMATSRLRFTTEQAVEKFGLDRYFEHIVTADDVTRHKPDPQVVEIILQKLGSAPERSVLVGDTIHDIQCAKNAGVMSVLVGWSMTLSGKKKEDFPPEDTPDHIIHAPGELLTILG